MRGDVEFVREGDRLIVLLPWASTVGEAAAAPVPPIPLGFDPSRPPTPSRITLALDLRGLWGPEPDEALGVAEPTVDLWESGDLIPTAEDVGRLATLTGLPPEFFYLDNAEPVEGSGWICGRGKRGGRCLPFGSGA